MGHFDSVGSRDRLWTHFPKRSCGAGSLLSLCLGLDVGLLGGLL
jgi:hypothetical protein